MNAIHLYRVAHWFHQKRIPLVPTLLRNLIFLIFNCYVPPSAIIGRGTVFAYGGIGVVIHKDAVIGDYCVIGQGVTIGAKEGYASVAPPTLCPVIGNHCYIAAGARLLGGIVIGDHAQIGAGAVVIDDVPDHGIAVGVPARVVGKTEEDFRAIRN